MKWLGPTWINVDLDGIYRNLEQVRQYSKALICAVLKGDAYGHGAIAIGQFFEDQHVDYLAVSDLPEALELREAGVRSPILVLEPCLPHQAPEVIDLNLTATVSSLEFITALAKQALSKGKKTNVHLKIDTGMSRVGVPPSCALNVVQRIAELPALKLEGIYSHFAAAYSDHDFTKKQLHALLAVKEQLVGAGWNQLIWHSANSAALLSFPESHLDMVRIGTLLYGQSLVRVRPEFHLHPTWTLFSRIIQVKPVQKGESIGYGRTYTTRRPSIIGIIPIGYGDGLGVAPNQNSHWQHIKTTITSILDHPRKVMIDGISYPIVGKIAMGMCCIDLTNHSKALDLYGAPVQIPTRRITVGKRIPKAYIINNKIRLISWRNRFWHPLCRNNQVYIKEIPFSKGKELLHRR